MGSNTVKIAAAIAAGYLIGRTRKARFVLALASGAMMAGRGLAQMGIDQSKLRGVLTEVLADVQTSAGKALTARAEQLTDSLRSQTEALNGAAEKVTGAVGLGQDQATEEDGAEDEEGPSDSSSEQDEARDQSNGGGEEPASRQTTRRPDRGRVSAARGGR